MVCGIDGFWNFTRNKNVNYIPADITLDDIEGSKTTIDAFTYFRHAKWRPKEDNVKPMVRYYSYFIPLVWPFISLK